MKKTMHKMITGVLFIFLSTAVMGQAKSDYDKDADFTKYKTYTFAGWQKDSDKQLNKFDKERVQKAFKAEFDARGMSLVDSSGDVTVTLYIVLEAKTSTSAYTSYNGGMGYGGRWGWGYGGAGMGTSTTTYSEDDYIEGTLVVDMYDAGINELVWQGVLQSTVKENPKKREKSIPKKIRKLMKKYPVKA